VMEWVCQAQEQAMIGAMASERRRRSREQGNG
jgi:hypothetical protein